MHTGDEHPQRWRILVVLCVCLAVVIVANTAVNVALPSMARSLGASITQLQWVVDAYSLVFAGLLFTGGTLGDRYGRKGALQVGLVLFLVAAFAAAVVGTSQGVIAARSMMGVGAALVMPATLSILTNIFPSTERPRAIAMWAVVSGAGGALGPIASGFLLEHYSWSAVFLVNVPVVVVALVAVTMMVPRSRDPRRTPIDWIGALLSAAGIGALVYAIIEAPVLGWTDPRTLAIGAVAFVLLAAFALWELKHPRPMLDLRYFRHRSFSIGSLGMGLVFFVLFGMMFLATQYFQLVLGYSALQAGVAIVPVAIVMVVLAPQAPKLVARFGANKEVAGSLGLMAMGLLAFSQLTPDTPYILLAPVLLCIGSGMALGMSPLTASIMAGVPQERAGIGSAMNDTTRELGGALGVAVMGSIATTYYAATVASALAGLPADAVATAESGIAGALSVAAENGMGELVRSAQVAYVDAVGIAMLPGAAIVAIAAAVVWKMLPARIPGTAAPGTKAQRDADAAAAVVAREEARADAFRARVAGAEAEV